MKCVKGELWEISDTYKILFSHQQLEEDWGEKVAYCGYGTRGATSLVNL